MTRATAFDCALRVLALRDHAEGELRGKLARKGYPDGEVEETVARLKELRYLDDLRFARAFASSAMRNGRGYGARLGMELARRGVSRDIAEVALAELKEEFVEDDLLAQLLERRFAGFDPASASEKERRKVVGYLQRKGFSLSAIFEKLKTKD